MDAVCSNKVDIIRTIVEYVEGQGTRQRRNSLNQLGLGESAIIGQCTERPWKFRNSKTIELLNAVDYAGIFLSRCFSFMRHRLLIKYEPRVQARKQAIFSSVRSHNAFYR